MSIHALPEVARRLLSSAQVLSDPSSVVKELLDNAIDAKSTSIEVTMSANCMDKIEVRDSGVGVAPEDFDALGRRGYTSKISSFGDVEIVAPHSLGFRGEALASATILGTVTVTTRRDGDTIASRITLNHGGGVAIQSSCSNPSGTTVVITNLFGNIPVRREQWKKEKESLKQILKVKRLMQAYAIARLQIRLHLKIHKKPNLSLIFSPRPQDSITDVVRQVLGRELSVECMEMTNRSDVAQNESTHPQFVFDAFLPKLTCNVSRISQDQYISIDGRPVSNSHGSIKKLVEIYKQSFRAAVGSTCKVKNMFLALRITCPPRSYDANVEPAKDQILFSDEHFLLECGRKFFEHAYDAVSCKSVPRNPMLAESSKDFVADIANDSIATITSNIVSGLTTGIAQDLSPLGLQEFPALSDEVSTIPEEPESLQKEGPLLQCLSQTSCVDSMIPKRSSPNDTRRSLEESPRANRFKAPWAAAYETMSREDVAQTLGSGRQMNAQQGFHQLDSRTSRAQLIPTENEQYSGQRDRNAIRRRSSRAHAPFHDEREQHFDNDIDLNVESHLHRWLNTAKQPNPREVAELSSDDPTVLDEDMLSLKNDAPSHPPARNIITSHEVYTGDNATPIHQVRNAAPRPRRAQNAKMKPFVPPFKKVQPTIIQSGVPPTPPHSSTMLKLRNASSPLIQPFAIDAAALVTNSDDDHDTRDPRPPLPTALPDGDPRAYLMRRRNSSAIHLSTTKQRLKRRVTALLPLETVPDAFQLQNLEQRLHGSVIVASLRHLMEVVARNDMYAVSGVNMFAWQCVNADCDAGAVTGIGVISGELDPPIVEELKSKIRAAVTTWRHKTRPSEAVGYGLIDMSGEGDIEVDLSAIFGDKGGSRASKLVLR